MKVDFKSSFTRDLKRIKDKDLLQQVKEAIEEVENSMNLQEVIEMLLTDGEPA